MANKGRQQGTHTSATRGRFSRLRSFRLPSLFQQLDLQWRGLNSERSDWRDGRNPFDARAADSLGCGERLKLVRWDSVELDYKIAILATYRRCVRPEVKERRRS